MKRLFITLFFCCFSAALFAQDEDTTYVEEEYVDDSYYAEDDVTISYVEDTKPFSLLDSPEVQLGLHIVSAPFFNQQSFGGGMDMLVRITNNFSSGISFAATGRRIHPTFGYLLGDARMTMADISWLNELTVVHANNFEAAVRLSMGWTGFVLSDNSIKERYWVWTEFGGYEAERALPVDKNNFFKVAPGMAFRYKLTKDIQLEAGGNYNFYVGNARFGRRADFNNYVLQLGVRINVF